MAFRIYRLESPQPPLYSAPPSPIYHLLPPTQNTYLSHTCIHKYACLRAYHPPLKPFLSLSSSCQNLCFSEWLVSFTSTLQTISLSWLLSFLCAPPSFTLLRPLPPLCSLPISCLCHQLGLAGSQAALGFARLALPLRVVRSGMAPQAQHGVCVCVCEKRKCLQCI